MRQKSRNIRNNGFTLIETLVVIALAGILTVGVGVLLADGQKSWNRSFDRVYGDSAVNGFTAQAAFEAVCRKASTRKYVLGDGGASLELYYRDDDSTASTPENYARFYLSNNELFVEYGLMQTGTWRPDSSGTTSTVKLAGDVETLKFTAQGTSVQMYLDYTGPDITPVVCSCVRHND